MADKEPTYNLLTIQKLLDDPKTRHITRRAYLEAVSLGYAGEDEMINVVKKLTNENFYKTMESTDFPGLWQDVYHPVDRGITLYVKLQIPSNGKGVVIQFKGK